MKEFGVSYLRLLWITTSANNARIVITSYPKFP